MLFSENLVWINRGLMFYVMQTVVAYLSFVETMLLLYLEYRVSYSSTKVPFAWTNGRDEKSFNIDSLVDRDNRSRQKIHIPD